VAGRGDGDGDDDNDNDDGSGVGRRRSNQVVACSAVQRAGQDSISRRVMDACSRGKPSGVMHLIPVRARAPTRLGALTCDSPKQQPSAKQFDFFLTPSHPPVRPIALLPPTMAADIATLSQLLQASLDPRQNKQGTSQPVYTAVLPVV
jgi:hypothetical protein